MANAKEQRINKIVKLYYSRKDVLKEIFNFSKKREVAPSFMMKHFGKRPDSFQYVGDIFELVKKGATSFHCSEELWKNPLDIATGMTQEQLNELRIGWDLLIDIDCKWIDYSKKAAEAIINVFKNHNIENIGVKFSVSGDTPVLIENKKDISLLPISEAISLFKKGKNIKVLSLDKNRKLKFSKVYDSLEHKDTLYEIKHAQSTIPLKATGHHSVFIWDKSNIIQKKVTEIKKGDFLISYNTLKNSFQNRTIEIINKFEFAKNQHSKKTIEKKIKVTKDLMRLIGYFLAEGHVTNTINQTGFSFNRNEVEYIEDVKNLLSKITKRKISIRHPNPNSTQILIHSKEWANFFDTYCGKKKNKHVPSFAFNASRELFLELLKGYIRGDGYKIGQYTIVAKSVSKKLITELIWLCKLNNISCNMSWEKNKPHLLPQGNMFNGSLVYMLRIPKSELENLEFYKERNKFSPYAGDKIFPVDGLKKVYKQIKPKMFNSHRSEQMTLKKKRANLNRIRKVLDWFYNFKSIEPDEISKKILLNYENLFNSDISVVEIKKISKKMKETVYDLSVEETESFFGNYYPILLHNSGSKGFHIILPWQSFPKEIGGEKTKNLFPELPRKLMAYIGFKANSEIQKLLTDKEIKQLTKKTDIKKGIKCNNCQNVAEEYTIEEHFCPNCHRKEFRRVVPGDKKKYKCPDCGRIFDIKSSTKIYECKKCNISSKENPSNFSKTMEIDFFELMGLDLVLVAPRHLFRMPYSLHEKTALASVVLDKNKISDFDMMRDANPLKVEVKNFLPKCKEEESKFLITEALDWAKDNQLKAGVSDEKIKGKYANFKQIQLKNIQDSQFPPCVRNILKGLTDGKKRALFVLINLFRSIGMDKEELEKRIFEWNKKNKPPLNEGYIKSQLSWGYKRKPIMPQNCKEFYQGIGVCQPDNLCNKIKNPVNYVIRKNFLSNKKTKK